MDNELEERFNPLDRGNLNQIQSVRVGEYVKSLKFQSPRSGKFESNYPDDTYPLWRVKKFQSPRSGKFESNWTRLGAPRMGSFRVSIP